MSAYPIEIINFGSPSFNSHETVIRDLNELQADIRYALPRSEHRNWAAPFQREDYATPWIWERLEDYRRQTKGFHPFVIAVVHGSLRSDSLSNLFGSHEATR